MTLQQLRHERFTRVGRGTLPQLIHRQSRECALTSNDQLSRDGNAAPSVVTLSAREKESESKSRSQTDRSPVRFDISVVVFGPPQVQATMTSETLPDEGALENAASGRKMCPRQE